MIAGTRFHASYAGIPIGSRVENIISMITQSNYKNDSSISGCVANAAGLGWNNENPGSIFRLRGRI